MSSSAARGSKRTGNGRFGGSRQPRVELRTKRQLQHGLESDALVADRLAGGLCGPPDVSERLDDRTWPGTSCPCSRPAAPAPRSGRCGRRSRSLSAGDAPGIGRVLQQLDEEAAVVLPTEDSFRASEGTRLLDLLRGRSGGALLHAFLDQCACVSARVVVPSCTASVTGPPAGTRLLRSLEASGGGRVRALAWTRQGRRPIQSGRLARRRPSRRY